MSDNEQKGITSVNIPDEIFEHHIWKHFSFNRWIRVFSLVCKKWKRICEESTVDPKQIHIDHKRMHDLAHYIQIVRKYQPTILKATLSFKHEYLFLVHRMCEASKRLHTLVLECQDPKNPFDIYARPINNITTLALSMIQVSDNFWQNLQIIFPNLKRLQVEQPSQFNKAFNIKVDHLTLIRQDDLPVAYLRAVDPDVLVHRKQKVIITKQSKAPHSRELTYEEHLRYFGDTELYIAMKHKNFSEVEKLIGSGKTSMEYEEELYDSNIYYKYPSSISTRSFDPHAYWSKITSKLEIYNQFVPTNLIPLPNSEKFIALSSFGMKKEALIELSNIDDDSLVRASVTNAFFTNFLPLVTKAELHQSTVIEKVKKIVHSANIKYINETDFDKISDLRDWTNDRLKSVLNKYNISLTMEKEGESLFNKRIQLSVTTGQELIENKHLVNHMDSSGKTPLSVALESPSNRSWFVIQKLLELGADPTKHRGDKLSPLGLIIVRPASSLYKEQVINIINLLIEHGADVNAPCLYEQRMCSPLMIAVLQFMDTDIIRLLIVLGARTDYVDETGRTIMDCVNSRDYFQRYIANDRAYLKCHIDELVKL